MHRRIFVWIDAVVIVATFALGHLLTPLLRPLREVAVGVVEAVVPLSSGFFEPGVQDLTLFGERLRMLVVVLPAMMLALLAVDAYGHARAMTRKRVLLVGPFATLLGVSAATLVIVLLRINEWSRLFLVTFWLLASISLTLVRVSIRMYYRAQAAKGRYRRRTLVVARSPRLAAAAAFVMRNWSESQAVVTGGVALPDARDADRTGTGPDDGAGAAGRATARLTAVAVLAGPQAVEVPPVPLLGPIEEIETVLLRHPINEVLIVLEGSDRWLGKAIGACDSAGLRVRLVPAALLNPMPLANLVVRAAESKVPSIVLGQRTWDAEKVQIKRLLDITVSATALLLLAPVFALVALVVRLVDGAPILYGYSLVGENGRAFIGWKFRTMVLNASAMKVDLQRHNEMTGPVFKMRNDPRVTPIGRWLRKYSLDELPQLYNVLKGDLSLVGPRAAGPHEYERYQFWQMRKISVRPGLTCLWQVSGRNTIANFDDWVRLDLEYIDNWSLWLDLRILARTVLVVMRGTGY